MSTKVVLDNILKKGKDVLRDVLGKYRFGTNPTAGRKIPLKKDTFLKQNNTKSVESNTNSRRNILIGRLFPNFAVSSELRRRTVTQFYQYGRLLRPTFAFGFAGLALQTNTNKSDDEDLSAEVRKIFSHREGKQTLVEQVQELSLDVFEFGYLIGQGCNAAVYEAKLNHGNLTGTHDQESLQNFEATDNVSDASFDTDTIDGCSDIVVLDQNPDEMEAKTVTDESHFDVVILSTASQDETPEDSMDYSWEDLDDSIVVLDVDTPQVQVLEEVPESDVAIATLHHSNTCQDQNAIITDGKSEPVLVEGFNDNLGGKDSGSHTSGSEYSLAIKMMFNYDVESNTESIMRMMLKESVPARMPVTDSSNEMWQNGNRVRLKSLPAHPNIVQMFGVFVDPVPALSGGLSQYPAALPQRINPTGLGRNKTMFLVMKKYDQTLRQYLAEEEPCLRTRCLLLTQLLEGVLHLQDHKVAHRDLKSDNILLECNSGVSSPELVISDFGCCLADPENGFKLSYSTAEIDRGGNGALMPPEIKCADPGKTVVLDNKKYDIWTVGTLVYEIFGSENPFYGGPTTSTKLESRSYKEDDLPNLSDEVPEVIQVLTRSILSRNPKERPTPTTAANLLQILLWFPDWLLLDSRPTYEKVLEGFMLMAAELLFISGVKDQESLSADNKLKFTLLKRLDIAEMMESLELYYTKF